MNQYHSEHDVNIPAKIGGVAGSNRDYPLQCSHQRRLTGDTSINIYPRIWFSLDVEDVYGDPRTEPIVIKYARKVEALAKAMEREFQEVFDAEKTTGTENRSR